MGHITLLRANYRQQAAQVLQDFIIFAGESNMTNKANKANKANRAYKPYKPHKPYKKKELLTTKTKIYHVKR